MRLVDSRSLISYASVVSVFAVLVLASMTVPLSAVLSNDTASDKKKENNKFLRRVEQKKKELHRYLKKDGSLEWVPSTTHGLPEKTMRALRIIRELRSPEFVDVLVPHIHVRVLGNQRLRGEYRRNSEYPVYHTIKEIGLPAIPRLIEALKESPPERESLRRLRRKIIVSTIKKIYEKAYTGHEHSLSSQESVGDRMMKILLEMEIERTEDKKKKARLHQALPDGGTRKRQKKEDGEEE